MKHVYVVAVSQVDTKIVKAQLCHFSRHSCWKISRLHTEPLSRKAVGLELTEILNFSVKKMRL